MGWKGFGRKRSYFINVLSWYFLAGTEENIGKACVNTIGAHAEIRTKYLTNTNLDP
jgi:hypothetical protein